MPLVYPIYGFHITKPIAVGSATVYPRTTDHQTAVDWSRDLNAYNLTGAFVTEAASDDFLFNFEAALAFVERLDVIIGPPTLLINVDPFFQVETLLRNGRRSGGGGEMIGKDTFFPSSRETFLRQVLHKLEDNAFCESTQFRQLFFKCVEQFRQRTPFVEVSYFFLFSGLETFARAVVNDRSSANAAIPISKLLCTYGFDVAIERPADPIRAISTYAHLRNALFHRGEFVVEINVNGTTVKFRLLEYLFNITQLTNLVVLKAIEFDDGRINWNSWVDRQAFK